MLRLSNRFLKAFRLSIIVLEVVVVGSYEINIAEIVFFYNLYAIIWPQFVHCIAAWKGQESFSMKIGFFPYRQLPRPRYNK